jgi:pyruvate kinase
MPLPAHKTKIVATLGPAANTQEKIAELIAAGMNIARLNFAHGELADHERVIANVRAAAAAAARDVAILADLPGPKIRIGDIQPDPVMIETGADLTLTTEPITGNATRASVSFARLPAVVRPGNRIFLNDGNITLEVTQVSGPEVRARVIAGGELRSRKGLNLPGIGLGVEAFTDYDRRCLRFALEHGVDAIGQSFVESAADIAAVRKAAAEVGRAPFVIAKIERSAALEHIDEILDAADGIMVARGDLGVEVPIERMAILQKELVRKAMVAGKPVITATQMLESMIQSPRPTRAESTDVANAILDGTDCVMLSGESATGKYPVAAVETLARIAEATEPHRERVEILRGESFPAKQPSLPDLISHAVEVVLENAAAAMVLAPTRTGVTARRIARFRLPVWIAAPSPFEATRRHLIFSYGVQPVTAASESEDWTRVARAWHAEHRLAGDLCLLVQGPSTENPDVNHRLELVELEPRSPDPEERTGTG